MQIFNVYPAMASGNCDFVHGRTTIDEDERIVSLDTEVDRLPSGILCLSSKTVEQMVAMLGWKLESDTADERLLQALIDLELATNDLDRLRLAADLLGMEDGEDEEDEEDQEDEEDE